MIPPAPGCKDAFQDHTGPLPQLQGGASSRVPNHRVTSSDPGVSVHLLCVSSARSASLGASRSSGGGLLP